MKLNYLKLFSIIISVFSIIYLVNLKNCNFENFKNTNRDIEISMLQKINKNVISRNNIGVTRDNYILCLFVINTDYKNKDKTTIGYMNSDDENYIRILRRLLDIPIRDFKLSSDKELTECDIFFAKLKSSDSLFTNLKQKYSMVSLEDSSLRNKMNFLIPFSKIRTLVDTKSNRIISVISVHNIILNAETKLEDIEKSKILNYHHKKKVYESKVKMKSKLSSDQVEELKSRDFDCVNPTDYSILTNYKTRQSCISEYDDFGDKKQVPTSWFKRCIVDDECEFNKIALNKYASRCDNGICKAPLEMDGKKLFYGKHILDYVFENDTESRLEQDLEPVLNLP